MNTGKFLISFFSISFFAGIFLSFQFHIRKKNIVGSNLTVQDTSKAFFEIELACPFYNATVIQPFGEYEHPSIKHFYCKNPGVDVLLGDDKNCYAVYEGEVSSIVNMPDGSGKFIIIRHDGFLSIYTNLDSVYLQKGDKVKTKQKLARVEERIESETIQQITRCADGSKKISREKEIVKHPGNWTCNFQLWENQNKLDPAEYISCLRKEEIGTPAKVLKVKKQPVRNLCGNANEEGSKKAGTCGFGEQEKVMQLKNRKK